MEIHECNRTPLCVQNEQSTVVVALHRLRGRQVAVAQNGHTMGVDGYSSTGKNSQKITGATKTENQIKNHYSSMF
jgi:hypothetical protein